MTPVELITTQDLISELMKRFDTLVFAAVVKRSSPESPDDQLRSIRYKGDAVRCLGLASMIAHFINDYYAEIEREITPEDL